MTEIQRLLPFSKLRGEHFLYHWEFLRATRVMPISWNNQSPKRSSRNFLSILKLLLFLLEQEEDTCVSHGFPVAILVRETNVAQHFPEAWLCIVASLFQSWSSSAQNLPLARFLLSPKIYLFTTDNNLSRCVWEAGMKISILE